MTSVVEPRSHARSRKLFQMFMISQNHLYAIDHGQPIVPCTLCHFPLWLMKPKAALEKGFIFLRPWWGLASWEVPGEVRMENGERRRRGDYVYNKYPSPSVYQLRKIWGNKKSEPQARVLCRGFFQLVNARVRDLLYWWYTPGHKPMSFDILLGCFSSRLCVASACNCGPCTGSPCMQSTKWLEQSFSTCIRQLADGSGR